MKPLPLDEARARFMRGSEKTCTCWGCDVKFASYRVDKLCPDCTRTYTVAERFLVKS